MINIHCVCCQIVLFQITNNLLTFNATCLSGTSVYVTVNYGDGTPLGLYNKIMSLMVPTPTAQVLSPTHSYAYSGVYFANVTIANDFQTFFFNCLIKVSGTIQNVSLISNSPVPFINGVATVSLWFISLRLPAVTSLVWNFKDSK